MAVTSIPSIPQVSIDVSAPTIESCDQRGHVAKVSTYFNCTNDFTLEVASTIETEKVPTITSQELKENPEFVSMLHENLNLVFSKCIGSLQDLLPDTGKSEMDILDSIPNSSSIEMINMPIENMLTLIAEAINAIIRSEEGKNSQDTDIIVTKSPKYPKAWNVTFQNSKKNYDIVERIHYPLVNIKLKPKGWELEHINKQPDQRDNPYTTSILIRAKERTV